MLFAMFTVLVAVSLGVLGYICGVGAVNYWGVDLRISICLIFAAIGFSAVGMFFIWDTLKGGGHMTRGRVFKAIFIALIWGGLYWAMTTVRSAAILVNSR